MIDIASTEAIQMPTFFGSHLLKPRALAEKVTAELPDAVSYLNRSPA